MELNTYATDLNRLSILDNKILIILQSESRHSHCDTLCESYNTVTISDLHALQILILVHKFGHHINKLPKRFTSYFIENQSFYDYNIQGKNRIHIISCNKSFGLQSIKYKVPSCRMYKVRYHCHIQLATAVSVDLRWPNFWDAVLTGNAPVCDPQTLYECVKPRLYEYVRNDETTKCNCPRQCSRLTYDYTISQAEYSNFLISFMIDIYKLNYTMDDIRYDMCALEVTVTDVSILYFFRKKNFRKLNKTLCRLKKSSNAQSITI